MVGREVRRVASRSRAGQTWRVASWLFLALSVLFFLLTLNSFRPIKHNRVLFIPSFFFSWLTNELAPVYLLTMIGIVLGFVWLGGVADDVVGIIGLIVMAVTWLLLGIIYIRGRKAGPEVDEALGSFGEDQHVERSHRTHYRKKKNITFAKVAGRNLKLDVTLPTEHAPHPDGWTRRPAILQIHGGGWIIGDKREQGLPLLRRLASNGWVGFNANYRLSPGATWPDHLVDCKRALTWIRENADEYGVDPNFIAVTGGSAGGHLSSLMALTTDDKSLQPGFEDADCSIQAAVPFYGVYDFTDRLDVQAKEMRSMVLEPLIMKASFDEEPEKFHAASPMDRVHENAPPFFVLHGDLDTLARVEDARLFVQLLSAVSRNPVFYAELAGAQHAFDIFDSPRTRRALHGVQRFLLECHHRYCLQGDRGSRGPSEAASPSGVSDGGSPRSTVPSSAAG